MPPPRPSKSGAKPWLKGQADDLASLANLDDDVLLEELRFRYAENKIYSYVGDILVAVNPFKQLPIYTQEVQAKYHNSVKSANPPHVYAIADQAYFAQRHSGKPQCAVISGESGAGKTESAKFLIRHIITLCHSGSEGAVLENKILLVNPLLEAFGNAQTLMNHNSSRFGKYSELMFNGKGAVVGAQISEYLLEKSRVVRQTPGECNFHIFYYIFAAREARDLGLTAISDFAYTRNTAQMPSGYQAAYKEVEKALVDVGFAPDEEINLRKVLACILHLGNISYDAVYSDLDPAQMSSDPSVLRRVAEMLGVDVGQLKDALTVVVTVTRGETIRKPLLVEQALDCRDAFAKTLYGRTFGWMVSQINDLLAPAASETQGNKKLSQIGILDIFGFEHFQHNGFEQMCINLANEQLQHFFNQHVFQLELEEYTKEGVDGTKITYVDNKPLLDMFLDRPVGLFCLLDEESVFPRATDGTLVQKYGLKFGSHKNFKLGKSDRSVFTVIHFAGKVQYNAEGFLAKNRDQLSPDVVTLLQDSQLPLIASIFLGEVTSTGALVPFKLDAGSGKKGSSKSAKVSAGVHKRPVTVGAQFTKSLATLVDKMTKCRPHFVRCIKPNTGKEPWNFQDDFVMIQLRYTGMLETTRIRREGYAVRPKFEEFVKRFKLLGFNVTAKPKPTKEACTKILERSEIDGWLAGKTKIFLKYYHLEQLDGLLLEHHRKAAMLQGVMRGFAARLEYAALKEQAAKQKAAVLDFIKSGETQGGNAFRAVRALRDYDMKRLKDKIIEEQEKATRAAKKRMQEEAEKAEAERRQTEAAHRQLKQEVETAQADFEGLSTQVARIMSGDQSMTANQRAEVEKLVRRLEDQLQTQQVSLDERVQEHEKVLSGLQAEVRSKEHVLQSIQAELSAAQLAVKQADGKDADTVANLRFKVRSQELRLEEKQADLTWLHAQVGERASILETVKSARNKVLGYVNNLLKEKEAIAAAYKAELAKAQEEHVKKLTSLKDEYEDKIDSLEKAIMEKDSQISLLETKLASQQELLDKSQQEHETATEQQKKLLASSKAEVAELSDKLGQQTAQLDALKSQNNATKAELDRVSSERDSLLEHQKHNFEQKLTEAQEQLRAKQTEMQETTVEHEAALFQLKLELQQKDMQLQSAVAEKDSVVQELTAKIERGEAEADASLRVELRQNELRLEESLATVARLESKLENQASLMDAAKAESMSVSGEYKRMLEHKDEQAAQIRQEHERQVKELEGKVAAEHKARQDKEAEYDGQLEALRRELRHKDMELESALAEKDDRIREVGTQSQMLRAEIDAERVKVHSLNLRVEEADSDVARMKERLQSQAALFESQKKELEVAHNELKQLLQEKSVAAESSRQEYKRIVSNLESQLRDEKEQSETQRLQGERTITNMQDDYEGRLSTLNDRIFEQDGQITDYRSNLERAETHVKELTSKLEDQAHLLDKTMGSLDDAVAELEQIKKAEDQQRLEEAAMHEAQLKAMEAKVAARDEEQQRSLANMAAAIKALGRKKPGAGPVQGEGTVDLLQYITVTNNGEPVPSDLMLSRYTCKGWLVRPVGKNWQKRWFVFDLKAGKLTWYMNNRELRIHAKGNIPLCDIKKTVQPKTKDAAENNSFLVCTATRTHHMRASSPEAMKIWLKCYNAILH
eukprot:m.411732 g.411732  ORF g.411732 m.411732 type:complete len:1663 (-) comp20165_c1_seq2:63-5051(-)